jgi:hypothetical protein
MMDDVDEAVSRASMRSSLRIAYHVLLVAVGLSIIELNLCPIINSTTLKIFTDLLLVQTGSNQIRTSPAILQVLKP